MWTKIKTTPPPKVRFYKFHFLILKSLKKWISVAFIYFWELSPKMLGLHFWVIRWYEAKDDINMQVQSIFSELLDDMKQKMILICKYRAFSPLLLERKKYWCFHRCRQCCVCRLNSPSVWACWLHYQRGRREEIKGWILSNIPGCLRVFRVPSSKCESSAVLGGR